MQKKSNKSFEYIIDGAPLQCSCGSMLSQLTASAKTILIQSKYPCTAKDRKPYINIAPFGICNKTDKPCILKLQEWKNVKIDTIMMGAPALMPYSYLPCTQGGTIEIIHHAQKDI